MKLRLFVKLPKKNPERNDENLVFDLIFHCLPVGAGTLQDARRCTELVIIIRQHVPNNSRKLFFWINLTDF